MTILISLAATYFKFCGKFVIILNLSITYSLNFLLHKPPLWAANNNEKKSIICFSLFLLSLNTVEWWQKEFIQWIMNGTFSCNYTVVVECCLDREREEMAGVRHCVNFEKLLIFICDNLRSLHNTNAGN